MWHVLHYYFGGTCASAGKDAGCCKPDYCDEVYDCVPNFCEVDLGNAYCYCDPSCAT